VRVTRASYVACAQREWTARDGACDFNGMEILGDCASRAEDFTRRFDAQATTPRAARHARARGGCWTERTRATIVVREAGTLDIRRESRSRRQRLAAAFAA
jgi:hypothetical protein